MYNSSKQFDQKVSERIRQMERRKFYLNITATIITGVIAILPTLTFFGIKYLLEPEGFWQKFAVYGVGIYFLGTAQLIFLIVYLGLLVTVIWD